MKFKKYLFANRIIVILSSLMLTMCIGTITPAQVLADDNGSISHFSPGTARDDGNIFQLTGVDITKYRDGINVGPYNQNKAGVDSFKSALAFASDQVIGYAKTDGAEGIEIVLLNIPGSPESATELLRTQGSIKQFELSVKLLGKWSSADGTTRVEVGVLEFLMPNPNMNGDFQTLSLVYMHNEFTTPGNPNCTAAVVGYLDTDTMTYVSAIDYCVKNDWSYHNYSWYHTATYYPENLYAGCDGEWSGFLWWHRFEGAWVTVDNYGNLAHDYYGYDA